MSKEASLRKFPYPFQAALTISTDNHANFPPEHFIDTHRLLNSEGDTPHGPGLGLEIADSFWFFSGNPSRTFTYFKGLSTEPSELAPLFRNYIGAGYIDTLHTYGDFSQPGVFYRPYAIQAVREMRDQNLNISVWVNHGNKNNIQNLNKGILHHQGANTESPGYHSDLTASAGVKFYWTSQLTKVVGQGRPITLREYAKIDWASPVYSGLRIARAYLRENVTCSSNRLLIPFELDDGRKVYTFHRFNNHDNIWRGVSSEDLDRQLSSTVLAQLVAQKGYMIVYNHLLDHFPFDGDDIEALRNLSKEFKAGSILVATTSRLLWYYLVHCCVQWDEERGSDETLRIRIRPVLVDDVLGEIELRERDLMGLTFYVADTERIAFFLGANRIKNVASNQPDETGRRSVSIPWQPLSFTPELYHRC